MTLLFFKIYQDGTHEKVFSEPSDEKEYNSLVILANIMIFTIFIILIVFWTIVVEKDEINAKEDFVTEVEYHYNIDFVDELIQDGSFATDKLLKAEYVTDDGVTEVIPVMVEVADGRLVVNILDVDFSETEFTNEAAEEFIKQRDLSAHSS